MDMDPCCNVGIRWSLLRTPSHRILEQDCHIFLPLFDLHRHIQQCMVTIHPTHWILHRLEFKSIKFWLISNLGYLISFVLSSKINLKIGHTWTRVFITSLTFCCTGAIYRAIITTELRSRIITYPSSGLISPSTRYGTLVPFTPFTPTTMNYFSRYYQIELWILISTLN